VKRVTFDPDSVRGAGEAAVGAIRRLLARKAADMILHDPDAAETAMEMGLIDRRWLENPERAPITGAGPSEVIERFLERAVESRPSRLSSLGLGAAQLLAGRLAPPSGRPEWMTVVFTDLEGFTAFTDREGDEAALALLQDHHREAGPIVRREGGRIVKHIGDGLLCTFGDPRGGLRAAVGLLDAAPEPLRLRAGVHVGEAISSPDDVIGHVVNVAARVAGTARGGQAVASLESVEAAGPTAGVVVGKVKSRKLKGISDRIAVVEISRDPQTRVAITAAR
jgi:class 3 adenylate cyclase